MKDFKDIKKLLINVDMVNGFVREGAMVAPCVEKIIPEHIRLIKQIRAENEAIAFVKDTHKANCREFKSYPAHCVEGTREAELVDELKPFEDDAIIYEKNSTSAIYAENFLENIEKMTNLQEVIVIGCLTDICILNLAIPLKNYFDQKDRDVTVTIPKNAVESYEAPNHNREEYSEIAFKLMKQAGINLVETL